MRLLELAQLARFLGARGNCQPLTCVVDLLGSIGLAQAVRSSCPRISSRVSAWHWLAWPVVSKLPGKQPGWQGSPRLLPGGACPGLCVTGCCGTCMLFGFWRAAQVDMAGLIGLVQFVLNCQYWLEVGRDADPPPAMLPGRAWGRARNAR